MGRGLARYQVSTQYGRSLPYTRRSLSVRNKHDARQTESGRANPRECYLRPLGAVYRFVRAIYTGQRVSDVAAMCWSDVENTAIRVVQGKTGTKLWIPLHPELNRVLEAWKKTNIVIVTTSYGKRFTSKGLSNFVADKIGRVIVEPSRRGGEIAEGIVTDARSTPPRERLPGAHATQVTAHVAFAEFGFEQRTHSHRITE